MREDPDERARQQRGILDNGGNPDPAISRGGWKANSVPAAAVRREGQAFFGLTGRKEYVGGSLG
jgi:hypothetical protein